MNDIRAALFDLDGTLLDRASSLDLFLHQQYERFAAPLFGIDPQVYLKTVVDLDRHGHAPKSDVYRELGAKFRLSDEITRSLLEDFEGRFHSLAIPFTGMHEMLQSLASMPLALGLVSNGTTRSQRPKIEALGIADYFGVILISEEEGVRKPDAEIFQRAMRKLGSVPENTIFVGDHPDADIAGAAQLGMKTIWKQNTCWLAPKASDWTIDRLEEIPSIIISWRSPQTRLTQPGRA